MQKIYSLQQHEYCTCNGLQLHHSRQDHTLWLHEPPQSTHRVPVVQVVPGEKTGGEERLSNHSINVRLTGVSVEVLLSQFTGGLPKESDGG